MKVKNSVFFGALALFPCVAGAVDLTGGNTAAANSVVGGANNNVPANTSLAFGFGNGVNGNFNSAFGANNNLFGSSNLVSGSGNSPVNGSFHTVLGAFNQVAAGTSGNFISGTSNNAQGNNSWFGGGNNSGSGNQNFLFGSFMRTGGFSGCVLLTDGNPFGIRSATNPVTNDRSNSLSAGFDQGYFLFTNNGQPGNPQAGLHITPSTLNTATSSSQAFVGINTVDPGVPLDVVGFANLNENINFFQRGNNTIQSFNGGAAYSIRASNGIVGSFIASNSDTRIKEIQGRSNSVEDLEKLLDIEITDYRYKDVVSNGSGLHKKVIAQQVEKIFPQAVNKSVGVVPDIFKKAPILGHWVALASDLKVGEKVRLIDHANAQTLQEVLEVKDGKFRTAYTTEEKEVFVYGREVQDFRSVDYDAISMLNVSATQQLKKEKDAQVQALRDENAALKGQVAAMKQQLTSQAVKDQAMELRMARLERAGSTASAVPVKVALTR